MKNISIIVPAREETEAIVSTLDALSHVRTPHEIIVVSDAIGDHDVTEKIVAVYARSHAGVQLVRKNIGVDTDGFAGALLRGVAAAKTPYVVFVMADLCDDPKTIDVMYQTIIKGWDVVCGSRYMHGGKKIGGPKIQGFFSWVVNASLHSIIGIPTLDASNAFKMYRTSLIKTLSFDQTRGVETSLSLVMQAYHHGAKITQLPTTWIGRTKGESKFRLFVQMQRYMSVYIQSLLWFRNRIAPRLQRE